MAVSLSCVSAVVVVLLLALPLPCNSQWARENLARQRSLAANVPLDLTTDVRTHNSFNSEASGYTYPNQALSLTDQLDIGARRIEFDVHRIDQLDPPVRVCHGSTDARNACLLADATYGTNPFVVCSILTPPILDYGDSTGCYSDAQTLVESLEEVEAWLRAPSNIQEVIILGFENDAEVTATDVNTALDSTIGDLVFTPQDKAAQFPDTWPSTQQLLDFGKRVIMRNSNGFGGEYFHQDPSWPSYPSNKVTYFRPYPDCDSTNTPSTPSRSFSGFFADESVIPSPIGGAPIYSGENDTGVMTPLVARQLSDCGFDSTFDFLTEEKAKLSVWSFEEPSPTADTSLNCAAMGMGANQGWVDQNCFQSYFHACQSDTDPLDWVFSNAAGNWFEGSESCPTGYSFSVPRVSLENFHLKQLKTAESQDFVWLQYSDITQEGQWETGFVEMPPTTGNPTTGAGTTGDAAVTDTVAGTGTTVTGTAGTGTETAGTGTDATGPTGSGASGTGNPSETGGETDTIDASKSSGSTQSGTPTSGTASSSDISSTVNIDAPLGESEDEESGLFGIGMIASALLVVGVAALLCCTCAAIYILQGRRKADSHL